MQYASPMARGDASALQLRLESPHLVRLSLCYARCRVVELRNSRYDNNTVPLSTFLRKV